jgi:DNA-binding NarL/FixJ family response regulator
MLSCSLKPDIAILDNNLEFIDGEEIPPILRIKSPSTSVVIVIARISDYQLYRAALNEVSGFVSKETDMDALPVIVKSVSEGRSFISPSLASRVLNLLCATGNKGFAESKSQARTGENEDDQSPGEHPAGYLSKNELRVLVEIGEGHNSGEIAHNTGLAVGTVRNYISSIMRKTGLNNRSQIVRYAFSSGLVPTGSYCFVREKWK